MNSRSIAFVKPLLSLMLLIAGRAIAYDAETHGLITYQAYQKSVLSDSGADLVINRLGLDRLDVPLPFHIYWQTSDPDYYYDNTASYDPSTYPRQPNYYEQCQMRNLLRAGGIPIDDPMLDESKTQIAYLPIQNWLLRGVMREDDLSPSGYKLASQDCGQPEIDPYGAITRVMNHFYDPINNQGLNPPAIPVPGTCALFAPTGVCLKSVDWALGYVDSFANPPVADTSRRNHFSYADARQNMWLALTGERGLATPPYTTAAHQADAQERLYRWATTFRSLGDVVHLLEDGAQPQHVRNDPHGPIVSSKEQQAFEGYTNARVLNDGTKVNSYVRGLFTTIPDSAKLPAIVTGNYPVVAFLTPLRFFTTRNAGDNASVLPDGRFGMLDYANRGFFTGGTRPGDSANIFQEPPTTVDVAHGYSPSSAPCFLSKQLSAQYNITCTHYMHAVPDSVTPGYADTLPTGFASPPLIAESVSNLFEGEYGILDLKSRYNVNLEEFQTMANLAIPRAIGYTAGLINYFFRGQLEVDAPSDNLIAVTDHSIAHTVDADGYPHCTDDVASPTVGQPALCTANAIYGFTSVRLDIRNTTASITESGTGTSVSQSMATTLATPEPSDPQLVAVARYHRNPCYQPDLSGELTSGSGGPNPPPTCPSGNRTAYQEISVSAPLAVAAATLNAGTTSTQNFDFSGDPIPINATDLFIQVVYRGPLGQEPDGIAVGMLDVAEPNYNTYWNNTDWFDLNGYWVTPAVGASGSGTDTTPVPINTLNICFNGNDVFNLFQPAFPTGIPPAQFARIAILTTPAPQDVEYVTLFNGQFVGVGGTTTPILRQADKEDGTGYSPAPIDAGRGVALGTWWGYAYEFYPDGSINQTARGLTPSLTGPLPGNVYFPAQADPTCAGLVMDAESVPAGTPRLGLSLNERNTR